MTPAIIGGVVGTVIGLGSTLWRQGGPLGDPDPPRFVIDNTWALGWAALGGGVGWLIGVALGWNVEPRTTSPSTVASWSLRALAVSFFVAGLLTLLSIPSAEEVRGSDTPFGYAMAPLTWIVVFDTALAVSTLLVLSLRTHMSRWVVTTAGALVWPR